MRRAQRQSSSSLLRQQIQLKAKCGGDSSKNGDATLHSTWAVRTCTPPAEHVAGRTDCCLQW